MKKEQLQIAFSIFDKQSFAAFCIKIASLQRYAVAEGAGGGHRPCVARAGARQGAPGLEEVKEVLFASQLVVSLL